MASAAWRVALVQALAASLWPPRALALERVVVSSLPRVLVQAPAVALMPRAPALQRVVVLTPRALVPLVVVLMSREPARLLAFVPRALGLQPGPSYVCTAGSRHRCSDLLYDSR